MSEAKVTGALELNSLPAFTEEAMSSRLGMLWREVKRTPPGVTALVDDERGAGAPFDEVAGAAVIGRTELGIDDDDSARPGRDLGEGGVAGVLKSMTVASKPVASNRVWLASASSRDRRGPTNKPHVFVSASKTG